MFRDLAFWNSPSSPQCLLRYVADILYITSPSVLHLPKGHHYHLLVSVLIKLTQAVLELVDEFIDSIATSACKMAKLRGSDTLDLKDVQIILERNWNIRIPGYAADEIRTVRKFHPAPGYHHKMAALSAQKQLAQTSGKGGE